MAYTIFYSDKIEFHQNSTFVIREVGCLVNMAALVLGFLGGSVQKVDLAVVVKKKGQL